MGHKTSESGRPTPPTPPGILARLGVVGMEEIEPVVLAALIQRDPLLLIGPHGTGKSYLLNRLAAALALDHRHYNASLLSFDDLVGYPLPNGTGSLDYVQTPASIWGAQSVFIDEISRCRPEVQNKLFSIIHERRIQGMALDRLVYRWSAMNPPASEDCDHGYSGSEPLDAALADRFAFILEIPDWQKLTAASQEALIMTREIVPDHEAAHKLAGDLGTGRTLLMHVRESMGGMLARYVRLVCALLRQGRLALSPRRAVMLLANIAGVHAARLLGQPDADLAVSALTALRHSVPQRATGEEVKEVTILAAHKEAWKNASVAADSPLHVLMAIPNPFRRALAALRCDSLGKPDFSTIVADCLAAIPPGGREAMAAHLFESGAAGRLIAAVAEQAAEWYATVATPQDIRESVQSNGPRHRVWKQVVARLAGLDPKDPDTAAATNLLTGLFGKGSLALETDVDAALDNWRSARRAISEAA
ncbi:MAG: AAA family ATPase [Bryobacteraceae bacterium]